jgi:pantoate kinase
MGSTGAGVNLEQGVATRVTIANAHNNKVSVLMNNRPLRRPEASKRVVDEYLQSAEGHWRVRVEHQCKLPIGAGYGTSGAGAVSLSLALNEAFRGQLSRIGALRVAHVADLEAKTGLGTVASVSAGGLAVRVSPGAPGIGRVRTIATPSRIRVVSGSFGKLSKPRILSSGRLTGRVNACSRGLVASLLDQGNASSFVSLSRKFADCLGLMSRRLRGVLDSLDQRGLVASMMMLGDGAFCIVPRDEARDVARLLRNAGMSAVISRVGRQGAHVL